MLKWLHRPVWSVKYLVGYGAMSIHEVTEFYRAWTKRGAHRAFMKHHKGKPPTTYQCNYDFGTMKNDIEKVDESYHSRVS